MESGKNANYWPGFVDALTNVVIAMIFVIVVLAIALSFAVQMMAKKMAAEIVEKNSAAQAASSSPPAPPAPTELDTDVLIPVTGDDRVPATEVVIKKTDRRLQLEFAATALNLDPAASQKLTDAVAGLNPKNGTLTVQIVAFGPGMQLSENQRNAFVRVLSVRNQLIKLGYPANRINTRIEINKEMAKPTISVLFGNKP